MNLFTLIGKIAIDGIDDASKKLEGLEGYVKKNEKTLRSLGTVLTGFGAAITGVMGLSVKSAANFSAAMSEVNSMMQLGQEEFEIFSQQVLKVSDDIGVNAVDSAKALYQIISAGIPKENAIDFLAIASKAAIAGVTDTTTAVDGLSTVINAFKLPLSDTKNVADKMFTAVKNGKTTFEELSASMSIVAPMAASMGVSIDDVLATIATLTKQGVPTAQAMTQIRAAMVALVSPSAEMTKLLDKAGYSSGQAMLQAKGFAGSMELLKEAANDNNTVLSEAFGRVEGLNALLGVTGDNATAAAKDLDDMARATEGAGAAIDAFNTVNNSASRKFTSLKESVQGLLITIGDKLIPILTNLVDAVKPVISKFAEWIDKHPTLSKYIVITIAAIGGLSAVLGPLLLLISTGTGQWILHTVAVVAHTVALGALKVAMFVATAAQYGLNTAMAANPIGAIILLITALVAAGVALWRNWDKVSVFFVNLWDNLKIVFASAVKFIVNTVLLPFIEYYSKIFGFLIQGIGKVVSLFNKEAGASIEAFSEKIKNARGEISDWADNLIESSQASKAQRQAVKDASEAVDESTEILDKNTTAVTDNKEQIDDFTDTVSEFKDKVLEVAEAYEYATSKAGYFGVTQDDLTQYLLAHGYQVEQITDLYDKWGGDVTAVIKQLGVDFKDVADFTIKNADDIADAVESLYDDMSTAAQDYHDLEIKSIEADVDAAKEAHTEKLSLLKNAYDTAVDLIDKELARRVSAYNEELSAIDAQLAAIGAARQHRDDAEKRDDLLSQIAAEKNTEARMELQRELGELVIESGDETWQEEQKLALEKEVANASNDRKRALAQEELDRYLLELEEQRQIDELNAKRSSVEDQIDEAESQADAEKAAAEDSYNTKVELENTYHDIYLNNQQARIDALDEELTNTLAAYETEKTAMKSKFDDELASAQNFVSAYNQIMAQLSMAQVSVSTTGIYTPTDNTSSQTDNSWLWDQAFDMASGAKKYADGGDILEPTLLYGMNSKSIYALAGEAGPERVVPGNGQSINITLVNPIIRERQDINATGRQIVDALRAAGVKVG
jgi:TP901 family phage tail tape measure protein